jgi:hypothetical protein
MKTVWQDHALALFFGLIFLTALVGQALTGVADYNNPQITDGLCRRIEGWITWFGRGVRGRSHSSGAAPADLLGALRAKPRKSACRPGAEGFA